ncbi:hypothetical protein GGX14DRAFT_570812 [Mycena pura]|uniref:Uncharacterized protein n=1 Tax=Mycena pura TaxID=153505 RepID=A0AAD6V889_9AGAR|nr:hypothetical protein GGX14DRAFT_570812 [Mycena pura]
MSKNGFRIAVTMHPEIVVYIHNVLSLHIDFTFKRVDRDMDEWEPEVAGFVDRINRRQTFANLYCDEQDRKAFAQLFHELFETVHLGTSKRLQLAPFYPDATCRVIMIHDGSGDGPDSVDNATPNSATVGTDDLPNVLSDNVPMSSSEFDPVTPQNLGLLSWDQLMPKSHISNSIDSAWPSEIHHEKCQNPARVWTALCKARKAW